MNFLGMMCISIKNKGYIMSDKPKEITTVSKGVSKAILVTSFLALGIGAVSIALQKYDSRSVEEVYADITQFKKCDLVIGQIPHGKYSLEGKTLECELTSEQKNDKALNNQALELRANLQKEVTQLLPSQLEKLESKMANNKKLEPVIATPKVQVRPTQEILSDLRKFEQCSIDGSIDSMAIYRGHEKNGNDKLSCYFTPEQKKLDNIAQTKLLRESLEKELANLPLETKKELIQQLNLSDARKNPESAILSILANSMTFESCEITKNDNVPAIECNPNASQVATPEALAFTNSRVAEMNINISQLDNPSLSKLQDRMNMIRGQKEILGTLFKNKPQ